MKSTKLPTKKTKFSYHYKEDLLKEGVEFDVGYKKEFARNNQTGEWYYLVADNVFRGPYSSKSMAQHCHAVAHKER